MSVFRFSVKLISLIFMALFSATQPSLSDELSDRSSIVREANSLFYSERFQELDELAERYMTEDMRTSSGLWKIGLFYFALDPMNLRDQDGNKIKRAGNIIERWNSSRPDSVPAKILLGKWLYANAWQKLGDDYEKDPSHKSWQRFRADVYDTVVYMEKIRDKAAADPNWYSYQIVILDAQNAQPEYVKTIIEEGLERFPIYYPIYFAAVDFFALRWKDKSRDLIEGFANASVKHSKNIDGMGVYSRIYWYAAQSRYGSNLFSETDFNWDKMRAGILDVLSQYPDQWNIQNFAYFACMAKDVEMTRSLFERMNSGIMENVWPDASTLNYCARL